MREFIYDFFIEPFTDGILGIIGGLLTWVLLFLCFMMLTIMAFGVLYLVDSSFMEEKQAKGIVTGKWIVPEHTDDSFILVGDIMVPTSTHYPTSYNIRIKIGGMEDNVEIKANYYNTIQTSQEVNCTYTNGRLYESLYIKDVSW